MDASMFVVFVVTLTMVICSHLIKQQPKTIITCLSLNLEYELIQASNIFKTCFVVHVTMSVTHQERVHKPLEVSREN